MAVLRPRWGPGRSTSGLRRRPGPGTPPGSSTPRPSAPRGPVAPSSAPPCPRIAPRTGPSSDDSSSKIQNRKYGIVYIRRRWPKKPQVEPFIESRIQERVHEEQANQGAKLEINHSASNFAEQVAGISNGDLCTAPDCQMLLTVLVERSWVGGSDRFSRILVSIMSWMRRSRAGLWGLAAILFSDSIAAVFSLHGIHFLPVERRKADALLREAVSGCGICKIYNAGHFDLTLSVDFSALPHYFKSMHAAIVLCSLYLPGVLARYLMDVIRSKEEYNSYVPSEPGFSGSEVKASMIPAIESKETSIVGEAPELVVQNTAIVCKFSPPKKKRTMRPRVGCNNCGPLKSKKLEGTKEMELALAEVKQNIDSVQCNVNILIMESDRCRREEGAKLMLEFSDSEEWYIAVKVRGVTRYLLKPQEWWPCAVNHVIGGYPWGWEDGWKLEFFDKSDWSVFKLLHMKCHERNSKSVPMKKIPIPGVREVSGYDETATPSFVRPDVYIHMRGDEVERALASGIVRYDMNSEDEKWLNQLNASSVDSEDDGLRHISEDNFEKIIFALEKDACTNPIPSEKRAVDLCQDLGRRDRVASVYFYWIKKRMKRRRPLVRVFEREKNCGKQKEPWKLLSNCAGEPRCSWRERIWWYTNLSWPKRLLRPNRYQNLLISLIIFLTERLRLLYRRVVRNCVVPFFAQRRRIFFIPWL